MAHAALIVPPGALALLGAIDERGAWVLVASLAAIAGVARWTRAPLEVAALGGVALLLAGGVLGSPDVAIAFGNPAVLAVASLFVVSAALEKTGIVQLVAVRLERLGSAGTGPLLLVMLPMSALLSAFVSNTLVVVFFTPVLVAVARHTETTTSRVLLPLSFATILGGTCTLIGTSTNLLVAGLVTQAGLEPIGMFELAWVGIPASAVGIVYLLIRGPRVLPDRPAGLNSLGPDARRYVTVLTIGEGSKLVGKTLDFLSSPLSDGVTILHVTRHGQRLVMPLRETPLEGGDEVTVTGNSTQLARLANRPGPDYLGEPNHEEDRVEALTFEGVVPPGSRQIGRLLADLQLRRRFGATVFAVHRQGHEILRKEDLETPLAFGDTVLMLGNEETLQRIRHSGLFLMLGDERRIRDVDRRHAITALTILAALVITSAFGWLTLIEAALLAGVAMVATGCLDPGDAYRAIHWNLLALIACALAVGRAVEQTGLDAALVELTLRPVADLSGDGGHYAVVAIVLVLTSILTEVLTNSAAAALMVPFALTAGAALGLDPRPLCLAVAVGASTSFLTPVGHPSNAFVHNLGGYSFGDFLRLGGPLKLLVLAVSAALIPWIWPL